MKRLLWVFVLAGTAFAIERFTNCPQDGARSQWTGQIQGGGPARQCEYSHTYGNDMTGYHTHTFWQQCGN